MERRSEKIKKTKAAELVKPASISELRPALEALPAAKLAKVCLQLARYKKDNKELLSYLLFEAHNLPGYLQQIRQEADQQFAMVNRGQLYFAKKSVRKILRLINKHVRYTGEPTAAVELGLYFCRKMKDLALHDTESVVLNNLYRSQLKKINATIGGLHEDLQYDYRRELDRLS